MPKIAVELEVPTNNCLLCSKQKGFWCQQWKKKLKIIDKKGKFILLRLPECKNSEIKESKLISQQKGGE